MKNTIVRSGVIGGINPLIVKCYHNNKAWFVSIERKGFSSYIKLLKFNHEYLAKEFYQAINNEV